MNRLFTPPILVSALSALAISACAPVDSELDTSGAAQTGRSALNSSHCFDLNVSFPSDWLDASHYEAPRH